MGLSRYYTPKAQEYTSQFVPENLRMMQNSINQRQSKSDATQKGLDMYEDDLLKKQALSGYDTEYLKGKRKEFDDYMSTLSDKDLSSAETIRGVSKFIRDFKGDEGLRKVQGAYDWNVQAQKAMADLQAKGKLAPENIKEYQDKLAQYTAAEGTGYMGQGLANNAFDADAPSRPEMEKLIDNVKANSLTYDNANGMWIDKHTNKEVTQERLNGIMQQNYAPFMNTQAGRQLKARAAMMGRSPQELYMEEATPVINERVYSDRSDTSTANTNFWKQKEEQDNQATAFWENGTTKGLLTEYETVSDINDAVLKLSGSQDPNDRRKAAMLKSQQVDLNNKFSSTLKQEEKDLYKINTSNADVMLQNDMLLREVVSDYQGGWKNSSNMNLDHDALMRQYQVIKQFNPEKMNNSLRRAAAKTKGIDYDNIDVRKDDYLAKQYVEETSDILLDAGKAGSTSRANISKALQTYVDDINYTMEGSDLPMQDVVSNIDPQSPKIRSSSQGPVIIFKTKATDEVPSETITLRYNNLGQGQTPDKGVTELYKELTGGDAGKFGRVMTEHKFANLTPMNEGVSYNAIQETVNLGDPQVNKFLSMNNAESVEYRKKDGLVNLYINGNIQTFKTPDGEVLNIKDIPTLVEFMKYNATKAESSN